MTTAAAPALRAPSPQPPGGSRRVDDPARSGALAPDAERSGGGQDCQHAGRATCGSCAEWRGPLCRPTAPGWRRAEVICLPGVVPALNCGTSERDVLASTMRPLAHVDLPMIGSPPLRIWVDLPRWGDGSTGEGPIPELTNNVIAWSLTGPAPS